MCSCQEICSEKRKSPVVAKNKILQQSPSKLDQRESPAKANNSCIKKRIILEKRNEQYTCMHEVKKVLATLVKTSETQTCTRISYEGNADQSSMHKNHRHPWNAPKQKLIHQLYHRWQSLKCWWWCNHTSRKNMLQLKASNGMILSAGAQLPLPAKPPAQVPPQQIWLQALNGEWKYVDV